MRSQLKQTVILLGGLALLSAVAVGIFAFGGGFDSGGIGTGSPAPQADLGPVIATVDGDPIYLSEAEARLQGLTSVHTGGVQTLGKKWQEGLLQSLVDDRIVQAQAPGLGVEVSPQDLSAQLIQIEKMFQTAQGFQQWLDSQAMDLNELERRIQTQLLTARVYTAVTANAKVDGGAVRSYYESHRDQYVSADGSISRFLDVRNSIRKTLLKKAQDRAYASWLTDQRQQVNVVVVDDNWWRNLA